MSQRTPLPEDIDSELATCEARRLFWADYLQSLQRLNKHNDEVFKFKIALVANKVAIVEADIKRFWAHKAEENLKRQEKTAKSCKETKCAFKLRDLQIEAATLREEVKMYKKESKYFQDEAERARVEVQRLRLVEDRSVLLDIALSTATERCEKLGKQLKIMEGPFTPEQLAKVKALFEALGL